MLGVGVPVAVTVNVGPLVPTVKVVLAGLVNTGVVLTVNVKV
jgi:hypothetical protein